MIDMNDVRIIRDAALVDAPPEMQPTIHAIFNVVLHFAQLAERFVVAQETIAAAQSHDFKAKVIETIREAKQRNIL